MHKKNKNKLTKLLTLLKSIGLWGARCCVLVERGLVRQSHYWYTSICAVAVRFRAGAEIDTSFVRKRLPKVLFAV